MDSIAAVILAAGRSSRMGKLKPLLPFANGTILSQCIKTVQASGVNKIYVITGAQSRAVEEEAKKAGAITIYNENFNQGMFSSIKTGIKNLPKDITSFFLLPGDMPLVRLETLNLLAEEFKKHCPLILYPLFLKKRGHPPLISCDLITQIVTHDGTEGLEKVLLQFESNSLDLNLVDCGIIYDIDTKTDYETAISLANREFPNDEECFQLWDMQSVSETVIAHSQTVAKLATALCNQLNSTPNVIRLDPLLIKGAALTHDICKGKPHHETLAADILKTYGFHRTADIVAQHSHIQFNPNGPITEKEVVFLADKLVRESDFIPLKTRYMEKLAIYGHNPDVKKIILERLNEANSILAHFDKILETSTEELAKEVLR